MADLAHEVLGVGLQSDRTPRLSAESEPFMYIIYYVMLR